MKIKIIDGKEVGCMSVVVENENTGFRVCLKDYLYPVKLPSGEMYLPIHGYKTRENAIENAKEYVSMINAQLNENFVIKDKQ